MAFTGAYEVPQSQSDIPVSEIMTSPAITIHPDATLAEAAQLMIDHRIGCLPIVDEEDGLIGLLTERSFFPSERKLPFTNQRMAWLLGEWVGDLHDLAGGPHSVYVSEQYDLHVSIS